MTTNNTPDCCIEHLARIEYPSSSTKVKLHGMAKPMTVTKKLQYENVTMEKCVTTLITVTSYAAYRRRLSFLTQFNRGNKTTSPTTY